MTEATVEELLAQYQEQNAEPPEEIEPPEELYDLPPSSKLVYYVLSKEGELHPEELSDECRVTVKTVHRSLLRLDGIGVIESRTLLDDARKRAYSVDEPGSSESKIEVPHVQ